MDLIEERRDGSEHVLATDLTPGEVDGILNWWRYTKPIGPNVKLLVRDDCGGIVCVCATGTALDRPLR